jgi:hypothetical protein
MAPLFIGSFLLVLSIQYGYEYWFRKDLLQDRFDSYGFSEDSMYSRWLRSKAALWTGRIATLLSIPASVMFIIIGLGTLLLE